jgi:hypothetical protein
VAVMKIPIAKSDEVTSDELVRIKEALEDMDGSSDIRLTDWECEFMDDLRERFEEYGPRLVMSSRQWVRLTRSRKNSE